jgi:hypothetical protein
MPADDLTWPPWDNWVDPRLRAHPDAPMGGGGPGGFAPVYPLGLMGASGAAPDPHAPWDSYGDPQALALEVLRREFAGPLARLERAVHWDEVLAMAGPILGRHSFGLGFCYGVAEAGVRDAVGLSELARTFIFADLYDCMQGRTFLSYPGGSLQLGAAVLGALGLLRAEQLRQAYVQRQALLQELKEVAHHPLRYLQALPGHIRDDYVKKWRDYTALDAKGDLESQFKAGKLVGAALLELAMAIMVVVDGAALAAKLANEAPELANLVRGLRRARGSAVSAVAHAAPGGAVPRLAPPSIVPRLVRTPAPSAVRMVRPPTPSPAERKLAASAGNTPAHRAAREKVVRDFYADRPGLGQVRASQDMGMHGDPPLPNTSPNGYGIDLSEPVQVKELPATMDQYVRTTGPGAGRPGNFFDPTGGQKGHQIGLNTDPGLRKPTTFETPAGRQGLESTAGPVLENWTDPDGRQPWLNGGGRQMTIDHDTRNLLRCLRCASNRCVCPGPLEH